VLHAHIFSNRSFLITQEEFIQGFCPPLVHLSLKELIVGDLCESRIESVTEECDSDFGETLQVLQELEVNAQRPRKPRQGYISKPGRPKRPVVDLNKLTDHAANYGQEELKRIFMNRQPQSTQSPPKKPQRGRSHAERVSRLSERKVVSKLLEVRRVHLRLSQYS
jgi:hypothetical protein